MITSTSALYLDLSVMPFTEKQIEERARELCRLAGVNPDARIQDYGRTSFHYPRWEDFRKEAKMLLEKEPEGALGRAFYKSVEIVGGPADRPPSPSPTDVLMQLAERCEREEPGDMLDIAIHNATGKEVRTLSLPGYSPHDCPRYTTSLDAAVTLVPEGFYWAIDYDSNARVVGPEDSRGFVPVGYSDKAESLVPAIALCAAALRARCRYMDSK